MRPQTEDVAAPLPLVVDMKALIDKIRDIRSLGIDDEILPLPKICVVGDQSTGKSSLVEGMSEIKVPRSEGLCTRCPLEINLTEAEPGSSWKCEISLISKYRFIGHDEVSEHTTSSTATIGPWAEFDPEISSFAETTDPNALPTYLAAAQRAILNPGIHWTKFRNPEFNFAYNLSEQEAEMFSPNVVRLDVSGPSLTNLSFYDLPGVISIAENEEDEYLVTLVEELVKQYIQTENCIVILAMPMNHDATNSNAARLVSECRAKDRTVGVLTKPDLVQQGGHEQWKDILRGEKFHVGHGYYVVKNNSNPMVAHRQARKEEEEFFEKTLPWAALHEFKDNFGTHNLQKALSKLLESQIKSALPSLRRSVDARIAEINSQLAAIPEPPPNCLIKLMEMLWEFRTQLATETDTSRMSMKTWNESATEFRSALTRSRPTLNCLTKAEQDIAMSFASFQSQAGEAPQTPSRKVQRTNGNGHGRTPMSQIIIDDDDMELLSSPCNNTPAVKRKRATNITPRKTNRPFQRWDSRVKEFNLAQIRDLNRQHASDGLPSIINARAIKELSQLSIEHWHLPMEEFLALSRHIGLAWSMKILKEVFKLHEEVPIFAKVQRLIEEFVEASCRGVRKYGAMIADVEETEQFTKNNEGLSRKEDEALQAFTAARHEARVVARVQQLQIQKGKLLTPEEKAKAAERARGSDLGEEPFAREIRMMAVSASL